MSKGQILRALVNERLTAAAEEIFALFERTIAEYEEELYRSKEENQRKKELLDLVLGPRVVLSKVGLQTTSVIQGPDLKEEITARIKDELGEQGLKVESEQEPVPAPQASVVGVKREEPSQPGHIEEEDNSLDSQTHPETHYSDSDEDWRAPLSAGAIRESAWAAEDHYTQVQITDINIAAQNSDFSCGLSSRHKSAPGATVNHEDKPGTSKGDEQKKHPCFVCDKRFTSKQHLETHIRIHTGERPYVCSYCNKRFGDPSALRGHMRTHTGERPFSCSVCKKTFTQSSNLRSHMRKHHRVETRSQLLMNKVHHEKNHEEPSNLK